VTTKRAGVLEYLPSTTRQRKVGLFSLRIRREQKGFKRDLKVALQYLKVLYFEYKHWKWLPREAVLSISGGFSRYDRIKP